MKKNKNFKLSIKESLLVVLIIFFAIDNISSQGVAINTTGTAADNSAALDIQFNDKGLLIPRLTTAERSLINSPAQGLLIFNVTTNCFETYINSMWQNVFCGCNPPLAPSAASHSASTNEIIWNWNHVAGADGYKYNTVLDYSSAIDIGNNLSYTQNALNCETTYTLYVWAYGQCGISSETALSQTTSLCFSCGDNISFFYKGGNVTYGTVTGQNNTCWLDRNLGASTFATAFNHADSYGDLFQWGRLDDGHQSRNSSTTTAISLNDNPGHSNYIKVSSSSADWLNTSNNSLWQGVNGINNPCPSGWRIPVLSEYIDEGASWTPQDYFGAVASPLKWPLAGIRNYDGTAPQHAGTHSWYWSSTLNGAEANYMWFFQGGTGAYSSYAGKGHGMSVRCIKDS